MRYDRVIKKRKLLEKLYDDVPKKFRRREGIKEIALEIFSKNPKQSFLKIMCEAKSVWEERNNPVKLNIKELS